MSATAAPPPPPPDGDVDRSTILLAVFWTEISIATVLVALRFYTRFTIRSIGADDWTILVTLIMYITTLSLCTPLVTYGLGRHMYYLTLEQQLQMVKWNWIVQPFGILTLPFGKISVVLLLQRLMPPSTKWRQWFLWINMGLFSAVMVIAAIISFAQCNPPRALWTQVEGAVCWEPSIQANWAIFGSAYSSFLDFVLALIPITIVWDLRMSMQKKIGLCLLLGVGALSGVAAAVKTAEARDLGVREDMSWALFSLYAWSATEIFCNIFCACIPTLKPLYDHMMKGIPIQSRIVSRYSASSPSNSSKLGWIKGSRPDSNGSDLESTGSRTVTTSVETSEPRFPAPVRADGMGNNTRGSYRAESAPYSWSVETEANIRMI